MDPWAFAYTGPMPVGSTSPNPPWGSSLSPLDSMMVSIGNPNLAAGNPGYFTGPMKNSVSPHESSTSPGSAFRAIYNAVPPTSAALVPPNAYPTHMQDPTQPPGPPVVSIKSEPIPTPGRSAPIGINPMQPMQSTAMPTNPIVISAAATNPAGVAGSFAFPVAAPPLQVPRTSHLGVPISRTNYIGGVYYQQRSAPPTAPTNVSNVNMYGSAEYGGSTPSGNSFSPLSGHVGPLGQSVYYVPDAALFKSSISPPVTGHLDGPSPNRTTPGSTPLGHASVLSPGNTPTPPGSSAGALGGGSALDNFTQPAIMYRNLFHAVECQLPLNDGIENYNGWRVFIDDTVGYAGNAKIFKRMPDKDERALLLTVKITDNHRNELFQCSSCREYFENRMYFKANPHIKGRIILVKNNNVVKLENGVFKINIKFMCCCKHQHVQHYILHLFVSDNISNNLVASAQFPIYVKQWRKSTQKKQSCTIMLS